MECVIQKDGKNYWSFIGMFGRCLLVRHAEFISASRSESGMCGRSDSMDCSGMGILVLLGTGDGEGSRET
jgi:hypothetical protein